MPLLLFALCHLFLPLLCRASLLLLLLSPSPDPCRYRTRRFCLSGFEAPSLLLHFPLLFVSAARQSEGAPDEVDPPPVDMKDSKIIKEHVCMDIRASDHDCCVWDWCHSFLKMAPRVLKKLLWNQIYICVEVRDIIQLKACVLVAACSRIRKAYRVFFSEHF